MRECSAITNQNFSDFLAKWRVEKNSLKKRKTAVALTVIPIDPKEQLQTEIQSLGYVEGLFIYTIIHANKSPLQACSSISEFFCFAGLMEIFSPATWRPASSAICREGKGLKELDISIIVPELMRYVLMWFWREFFAILHRKLSSSFS